MAAAVPWDAGEEWCDRVGRPIPGVEGTRQTHHCPSCLLHLPWRSQSPLQKPSLGFSRASSVPTLSSPEVAPGETIKQRGSGVGEHTPQPPRPSEGLFLKVSYCECRCRSREGFVDHPKADTPRLTGDCSQVQTGPASGATAPRRDFSDSLHCLTVLQAPRSKEVACADSLSLD